MTTNTSIGPGPERGGNESHGNADGRGNKTLGEGVKQAPESGAIPPVEPAPPQLDSDEAGEPQPE